MLNVSYADMLAAVAGPAQCPSGSPGTLPADACIDTPEGARAVGDLVPGDLVRTVDGDVRPVRRIETAQAGEAVLVPAHALGLGCPARDVVLSPDQMVMLSGWQVEIVTGEPEALVPVREMIGLRGIAALPPRPARGLQAWFDTAQIVTVDGLPVLCDGLFPTRKAPRMVLDRAETVSALSLS